MGWEYLIVTGRRRWGRTSIVGAMTVVEINVRGAHTVTLAPERATIHATVGMEGPPPEPVFEAVAAGWPRWRDRSTSYTTPSGGR